MVSDFKVRKRHSSRVEQLLKEEKIFYIITSKKSIKSNYIRVPSVNLIVPKKEISYNNNFCQTQIKLHANNKKILTPYEFIEFLKESEKQDINLFNEITQPKSLWGAEWLNADFKMKDNEIYITYHMFNSNGKIIKKSEKLDKNTLIEDKTPGISLDYWIKNPTTQGLPRKSTLFGDLDYWAPRSDNDSFVVFNTFRDKTYLDAGGYSFNRNFNIKVRAAEQLR